MIEIKRTIKAKVSPKKLLVGDTIGFTLTDGEYVEAMAVAKGNQGTLFVTVDCLKKEYNMNPTNTNDGGYEKSELRKKLNGEILERFPEDIKKLMLPMENGDMLRIPTEREIFGKNIYGEPDIKAQWEPMKLRRNRIAYEGYNGYWQWYCLQNVSKEKEYASCFAGVNYHGNATCGYALAAGGVRPVFLLKGGYCEF